MKKILTLIIISLFLFVDSITSQFDCSTVKVDDLIKNFDSLSAINEDLNYTGCCNENNICTKTEDKKDPCKSEVEVNPKSFFV
jgi:hypothetical protein